MFTAHQIQVMAALVTWALDQDHDMPDYPEHLSDLCDSDAYELSRILDSLRMPFADRTAGGSYVQAARHLAENICDSLPQTDDIRTAADADTVLSELTQHAAALADADRRSPRAQLAVLLGLPYGTDLDLSSEQAAFNETDRLSRRATDEQPSCDDFLREWLTDGSPSDSLQEEQLTALFTHAAALRQAYPRRPLADCLLQASICLNG